MAFFIPLSCVTLYHPLVLFTKNNKLWIERKECVFLVARCKIIRALWESKKKRLELQKKVNRRICVRDITFSAARPSDIIILSLFSSTPILLRKIFFAPINSGGKKRDWYPSFTFPQCPLPCVAKVLAETDAAIFRCVLRKRCTSFSKLFTCKSLSKKLFAQILINLLFFCKICRTLFLRASFNAEAVARRCSIKKVFLEISQNLQENSCSRVSFLMKLQTEVWSL